MKFYTARELKPTGLMRAQLELQARGLSGNLQKVWPDIRDSAWIGGSREGWERVPYWLDGFIPLAFLLEDDALIADARRYIDAIISFQQEDGWICPCSKEARAGYDTWAVLLISKVLTVWADCSGEEARIVDVLSRVFADFARHITYHPLRDWGRSRWYEGLIAVAWLYERTGDDDLVRLANMLCAQGVDWRRLICGGVLTKPGSSWNQFSHVVNIAMMLRSEALMKPFSGRDFDADELGEYAYNFLLTRHGTAYGHFNGDECLAPSSPIRGSELCGVVEAMYSYEWLYALTGKAKWLDRLELLAFNGLPATLSEDMWSHQYDQMANQIECTPMKTSIFGSNSSDAHIFGLEPNFGCCTANFSQGFPKLALSAFFKSERGISAGALVPAELTTEINGVKVKVKTVTDYPFENHVRYEIKAEKPVCFGFTVRIPSAVDSATLGGESIAPGTVEILEREWYDDVVELEFETKPKLVERPSGLFCVRCGVLLFALPVESKREPVEYVASGVERKYPYCDWRITPESKWSYGFKKDAELRVIREAHEDAAPFSEAAPRVAIETELAEITWDYAANGHCAELPRGIVPLAVETRRLIPYGCTTLRMTELPIV